MDWIPSGAKEGGDTAGNGSADGPPTGREMVCGGYANRQIG